MLLPEILFLLLANPHDGDVPTLEYPRVKNCLQASLAWELERAGSIVVEKETVVSGPRRPTPLGPEVEKLLASLSRPEPQTHHWFFLRLDPEKGLITEFFAHRLAGRGLLESKIVSHLIFLKKTVFPRTPGGGEKATELTGLLEKALADLKGETLDSTAHAPEILVGAFYLDAFRLTPRLTGSQEEQKQCQITKSSLKTLVDCKLVSTHLAQATYRYSHDVSDLGSLVKAGGGFLEWLVED